MSDLIVPLLELRQLPTNIHLLCPREDVDDQDRYEEDVQGVPLSAITDIKRQHRVRDARDRREKFISCLQLLAYDGNESEKYQRMIWDVLDETLGKCDICIRNYYVEKLRFLAKLREDYEESDVQQFFGLIDRRDIARITKGLSAAERTLQAAPEQKRGTQALEREPTQLHALFEALLCEAFLKDEELVTKHFDEPFRLIQSRKQLKIREILPSTVRFLFSTNHRRLTWATTTWGRLDRTPTELEWSWSIKDHLQERLQQCTDPQSIARFWSGLMTIVKTLSEDMITHQLFDIQPKICTAALDHLHKPTAAVPFITASLGTIIEKAPKAFWQMMGPISTQTIAEQIFGSPRFTKALNDVPADDTQPHIGVLQWCVPLLSSLEIGNQPAACQALTSQLFDKMHVLGVTEEGKKACLETAVKVMLKTAVAFSADGPDKQSPGRMVVNNVLKIISDHLGDILDPRRVGITSDVSRHVRRGVLDIVRNAIALDCQCLRGDFQILRTKRPPKIEKIESNHTVWQTVIDNLSSDDTGLSVELVLGLTSLFGIEPFRLRDTEMSTEPTISRKIFNNMFSKTCESVSRALEKIADFNPEHLDSLYKRQETCLSLVATLFASDESIRQASTSLIKNISGEPSRKDALRHLLEAFFVPTIYGLSWSLRRISTLGVFAPVPSMVSACMDILDLLCDSQHGILRLRQQINTDEARAIQSFWSYQWIALKTIFQHLEAWSADHPKTLLTEVARDTMEYAQSLFEQYHTFARVLTKAASSKEAATITSHLLAGKKMDNREVGSPVTTIGPMSKWLRLRDQFLADTQVKLLTNMLNRLKSHGITAEIEGLEYVRKVLTDPKEKNVLSETDKATIARAYEHYTGDQLPRPDKAKKQSKLQLQQWADSANKSVSSSRKSSTDEFGDDDIADADMYELSKNYATLQKDKAKHPSGLSKPASRPSSLSSKKPEQKVPSINELERKKFIEERKKLQQEKDQKRKDYEARQKGKALGEGMGFMGKEHTAPKESNMMVSSESEGDSDEEVLGSKVQTVRPAQQMPGKKPVQTGPIKKIKQVRSQKDMRARLQPDLGGLHKTLLGWDFFADTDLPPNSTTSDYTMVTNEFRTVQEYQKTFEQLLILEGWQSFRAAREDGTFKPFKITIANSMLIDSFFEVNVSMPMAQGQELGLSATDVVLLSKSEHPTSDPDQPHCLARIKSISRKKGEFSIVFRINAAGNPLRPHLNDKAAVYGAQILSLTTLEREYGALMALTYYDLADEVIAAKPSPLLHYTSQELQPLMRTYDVNEAQARAVKSAIDNDAFTLVQGPPGSGKTKTICAIVGALMTGHVSKELKKGPQLNTANGPAPVPKAEKRLMVCAPSNAAVDELVMRLKKGLKLADGSSTKINVVRLGRSEAINSNVKDVTLEELVNAKLDIKPKDQREDVQTYMMDHKAISQEVLKQRNIFDAKRQKGEVISEKDNIAFEALKRQKAQLGTKIDHMKDSAQHEIRNAEMNRKRVQQEILDGAHVLCATLSGSGHDLFQSLNVEFETVIIDEAAQSIELSALIPLKYGCSKCILVGDPKQLPPTVLSREAARFQYEQSLFARMEKNHKKNIHLLDTQYRMHPEISFFPSRTFYDSRLKDGAGMAKLRARPWHHSSILAPYRFFDIQGMSQSETKGHSLINITEINIAMTMYDRLITDLPRYNFRGKIGIITPYKGQLRELKRRFQGRYGEGITSAIEFNTTDAFQGRESEIIIFSCVRASTKGIGFLNDIRRMNVGLTRAKSSLWVLGNSEALNQGEFWRSLISDAKSRKLYTEGDIASLFKKPLLTADMIKDDVEMVDVDSPAVVSEVEEMPQSNTISSATINGSTSAARPSLPPSRKSSSASIISISRPEPTRRDTGKSNLSNALSDRSRESSPANKSTASSSAASNRPSHAEQRHESRIGKDGPSGGRYGFNDLATCNICGSSDHFTFKCDNDEARASMIGKCHRCFDVSHTWANCKAPRCTECGEVGHVSGECAAPMNMRLDEEQKASVRRQEEQFVRRREKDVQKLKKKQLGEHGGEIPTVRASLPEDTPREPKGARGAAPPGYAPTGPKRMRENGGAVPGDRERMKVPRIDGAREGSGPARASMDGAANAQSNAGATKGASRSSLGAGGGGGIPGGQPQVVKKKKPAADAMFLKKK